MRRTIVAIAVLGFLCGVSSLPATSKQIDDGVEFVGPKDPFGEQPIIDTNAGFDDIGYSNPFGGIFENIESLMARVRQQMNDLLSRFPMISSGNASDEFPDLPDNFPALNIDLGKGNTTSVTKIIDGHKVVINQTEYHKDDEQGSAFFKVRIIDVQPQETSTEKEAEEVTQKGTTKDRESLENTFDNEIVKGKEAPYLQSIESFDTVDYPRWMDVGQLAPVDDNSLNFEPLRDLSRDTYVNELLAQSGATPNPDAEFVDIVPQVAQNAPMRKYQYLSVRR